MSIYARTERIATHVATGLAVIGGLGLIFATIVTCISIVFKLLRRSVDTVTGTTAEILPWAHAILGEEELVTYGVGFALFAALPWVMLQRGHIKIDLFAASFSPRFNKILDLLGDVILAALAYLIMTRQWFLIFRKARRSEESLIDTLLQGDIAGVMSRMQSSQESQILGVPLWPTYIVAEICVVIFFFVALFCVWRSLRALTGTQPVEG